MTLAIALTVAVAQAVTPQPAKPDPVEARFLAIDAVARKADFKTATAMAKAFDDEVAAKRPFDPALRYRTLRFYRAMLSRVDGEASHALLEPLVALVDAHFGPRDSRRLQAHYDQANLAFSRCKPGATLEAVEAALVPLAEVSETESERLNVARALASLAADLANNGKVARARPLAARALAMADAIPTNTLRRGQVYGFLARVEAAAGNPRGGIALSERAVKVFEADNAEAHGSIPPTVGNAAGFASEIGDYRAAEGYLRRAVAMVDANPGFSPETRVRALLDYGKFLADTQRFDLAIPMLAKAGSVADAAFKGPHPLREAVAKISGNAYLEAGLPGDAAAYFERGVAMLSTPNASARARGLMRIDLARAEIIDRQVAAADAALAKAAEDFAGLDTKDDVFLVLDTMKARLAAERGDAADAAARYEAVAVRFDPNRPSALRNTAIVSAGVQRAKIGTVDMATWARARAATDATIRVSADIRAVSASTPDQRRLTEMLDSALDIAWAAAKPRRQ